MRGHALEEKSRVICNTFTWSDLSPEEKSEELHMVQVSIQPSLFLLDKSRE